MQKSKRKSTDSLVRPAKKLKPKYVEEGNPFYELSQKAGFIFAAENEANQLSKDQAVFQQEIRMLIKRHPEFPEVVAEFTEGFTQHIEDLQRFFWSLMPSGTSADADESCRGGNQESLVRLLLGVEQLQVQLMKALLEKLAEFTGSEETFMYQKQRVNLPRLILHQFRWLDRIVNSKEIAEKMLEILCIVSLDTQREIITCIPEIIDDNEHNMVAKELRDMLQGNNELTVPILDSLTNLNVKSDTLSEIRGAVVDSIPSVEADDLPVIIKFLLQTLNQTDALQVIRDLRTKLDLQSLSVGRKGKKSSKQSSTDRGDETLILDAIRSGIRFQKSVAEAWIKAIDLLKSGNEHKVLDVLVLLVLHSNGYKKPVESLIRNKIRAGHFSDALLQSTFSISPQVLRELFPSLLDLAEVLLRSPEPIITHVASAIYKHAFITLDTYCQQELVGNLVMHISSGVEDEVDTALAILEYLVEKHGNKMAPFTVFVKGVLDYLEHLSVGQMRHLYSLLSHLAYRTSAQEGSMQDEMHIIILKQLTNSDNKYKRMGVIGAIMIVKSMAYHKKGSEELSEEAYNQVVRLLQLVSSSSNRHCIASALYMDELASLVRSAVLHPKVEAWIADHVINDFQDDFVVDLEPGNASGEALLHYEAEFGLDDDAEGNIAINIMPLVAKNSTTRPSDKSSRVVSPVCIAPHFRLLQVCEVRQGEGKLEGIDALLGCPVFMPKLDMVDKLESLSQQEVSGYCETLFLTVNWFREVVNAFASQEDPEMKGKVISRLHHITQINEALQQALAVATNFQPPMANFELEEAKVPSSAAAGPSGVKKGRKPAKGKKKKGDQENNSDDNSKDSSQLAGDQSVMEKTQVEKNAAGKPLVNLSKYTPFFRELDLDVFCVLNISLVTKKGLDTQMQTEEEESVQIQPEQLLFLMEDLLRKLQHALPASASKRRFTLKPSVEKLSGFCHLDELGSDVVASKVLQLLPALCDHLERTSAYFQAQMAANDGVMDGPGSFSEESLLMAQCLSLLLQALTSYFSWTGFQLPEQREKLREGLAVLAGRLNEQGVTQMNLQQVLKYGRRYVEKFASTVPNMTTAVMLAKLLAVLEERSDSGDSSTKLGEMCGEFLKQQWYNLEGQPDRGARFNELLQQLLKLYFGHCEDVLKGLESLATVGFQELLDAEKNGSSATYPTLTRNSLPVFYRTMLSELIDCLKSFPCKTYDSEKNKVDALLRWGISVRIFHILVNIIKAFDSRYNIGALMKYGRQFVELFLRLGMPVLDSMFKSHHDDIASLLKNLQLSTRYMHHMCGHSKILRDVTLTNQVPLLKKALESFVYRVKAMLIMNKCMDAFWLGNLKNRDLQGEEIVSQSTVDDTSSKDSDEDEALPPDEEDSDLDVNNTEDVSNNPKDDSDSEGYSETY